MSKRHTSYHNMVAGRILCALQTLGNATTWQLCEHINNVSAPSIYRIVKKLHEQEFIEVHSERKVRGTMERVYALPGDGLRLPLPATCNR